MGSYVSSSYNTKSRLSMAFLCILEKKPIQKISIKEITDACGFNRQTFYYHFEDIYSLATWTTKEFTQLILQDVNPRGDWKAFILAVLQKLHENDKIRNLLLHTFDNKRMHELIFDNVYALVEKYCKTLPSLEKRYKDADEKTQKFVFYFYSTAILAVVDDWMEEGMKQSPEELVFLLEHVIPQ